MNMLGETTIYHHLSGSMARSCCGMRQKLKWGGCVPQRKNELTSMYPNGLSMNTTNDQRTKRRRCSWVATLTRPGHLRSLYPCLHMSTHACTIIYRQLVCVTQVEIWYIYIHPWCIMHESRSPSFLLCIVHMDPIYCRLGEARFIAQLEIVIKKKSSFKVTIDEAWLSEKEMKEDYGWSVCCP